jgi:hypothetical protein
MPSWQAPLKRVNAASFPPNLKYCTYSESEAVDILDFLITNNTVASLAVPA